MVGLSGGEEKGGDVGGVTPSLPATYWRLGIYGLVRQTEADTDSNQINNKPRWWLQ